MVEAPKIDTVEIGNTLTVTEISEIEKLTVDAFDKDATKENSEEMKNVLKTTKINVVTSDATTTPEAKTQLSLWDIATQFDQFVEKWEGWKLKLKNEANKDNPAWITYIVNNPKNNDLAYLVQKLAGLIEYQTAKAYTETEVAAVEVWIDKAFGNQTRRALAGLKNWIESDISSTETITFLSKSKISDIITANTKSWTIDKYTLNKALLSYHLIFDNDKRVKPIDWYTFIDPNSTNYATKEWASTETQKLTLDIVNKNPDKYFLSANGTDFVPKTWYVRRHMPHKDDYSVIQQDIVNDPAKYNLTIDKNGNYEPVEWYVRANKDDPNDYSVIKVSNGTEATTNIDTEKKIGKKIFENYENKIKEYISSNVPSLQLQTSVSDNPYIYVADSKTWNTVEKININNYIKDGALDMTVLKNTIDWIKTRIDNLEKTIKILRGKSYSVTDLFGTDKKFQTDAYNTFFNYFKNNDNKISIDKSETYTLYQATSGTEIHYSKIQFDLDQDWYWDHAYCKGLIIDVVNDKVINQDGTLNETELKKFLANKITTIIEDPKNGYA